MKKVIAISGAILGGCIAIIGAIKAVPYIIHGLRMLKYEACINDEEDLEYGSIAQADK